MVVVAQLVEHRVVVPGVAGSSPVDHPIHAGTSRPGRQTGPVAYPRRDRQRRALKLLSKRLARHAALPRRQPTVSRPESAQTPDMSAPAALTAAIASGSPSLPFA